MRPLEFFNIFLEILDLVLQELLGDVSQLGLVKCIEFFSLGDNLLDDGLQEILQFLGFFLVLHHRLHVNSQ